jgi:hypothetical protein
MPFLWQKESGKTDVNLFLRTLKFGRQPRRPGWYIILFFVGRIYLSGIKHMAGRHITYLVKTYHTL